MAGASEEMQALFEKLDSQVQGSQFKKALKTCADILKKSPKDDDALTANALLLVETGAFAEAMVFLKKHKGVDKKLAYEKAYALYRLGRYEEALSELSNVPDDRLEAKLQLQAQLQYRLGQGEDAYAAYKRIINELQVSTPEVQTNAVAAALLAGKEEEGLALVPAAGGRRSATAKLTFEAVFNRACCLLQAGSPEEAEETLQLAQTLGQEALLEEGLEDAEVEAELAPIAAQLAYTYSRLGRSPEAIASYSALLALPDVTDDVVLAVARNNLFAERLAGHAHKKLVADALKKMEGLVDKADHSKLKSELDRRLADPQRLVLLSNYALLLLLSGRTDAARSTLSTLSAKFGAGKGAARLAVLQAAALAQENKVAEAGSLLAQAASASPDALVPATLMQAQLATAAGNLAAAAQLLRGLASGPLQHKPALVASLVGLHLKQGDLPAAEQLLQQALSHWRTAQGADSEQRAAGLEYVLQQLAQLRLKAGDVEGAAAHFSELHQLTGGLTSGGARVLSNLARAMALSDKPSGAAMLEKQLTQLPEQGNAASIETAALGEGLRRSVAGLLRIPGPDEMDAEGPGAAAAAAVRVGGKSRKRKRRNKTRLPKNFDPANPGPAPDPERWLAKWQRSDAKKKRTSRNRGKDMVKGSQGAGKVDESLDITSAAAQAKAKATAGPVLPPPGKKGGKKGRR